MKTSHPYIIAVLAGIIFYLWPHYKIISSILFTFTVFFTYEYFGAILFYSIRYKKDDSTKKEEPKKPK